MKVIRPIFFILCLLITIYSLYQARAYTNLAKEAKAEAITIRDRAVEIQQEAEKQRDLAIQGAAEARKAQGDAEMVRKALEDCQK